MRLLAILLTIVSLVGCAAPNPNAGTPASQADAAKLTTVIASADLAVGANHFALALLDASNQPLADLPVYLGFYGLSGPEPVQLALTEAVWRQPRGEWNRGVYKADV